MIPNFQKLFLPILKIIGDQQEHSLSDISQTLAKQFALTEAERLQMLSSGKQRLFDNRVGWARTYLKKAGLLTITGIGRVKITPIGLQLLQRQPADLDWKALMQFPEFQVFHSSQRREQPEDETRTPVDLIDSSFKRVRTELAESLLEKVKQVSPDFFEQLVVDLLVKMGYGGPRKDAGQAVGHSGDGGVDGIINEDKLGLDVVYIQAKRWEGVVGRPQIQAFAGSLEGQRARKGVFITTSGFTNEAREYVGRIEKKVVLIDGERLADLMIEYGLGVTDVATYSIKKIDLDYFASQE